MTKSNRAVLFANGDSVPDYSVEISASDFLIAVDGGLRHLLNLNLTPHVLIGDLDSVTAEDLKKCETANVEIIRFSPMKDQSDLELALDLANQLQFKQILIAYAHGSRSDHSLANIALLSRPDLRNLEVSLDDGKTEIALLSGPVDRTIVVKTGDLISLLPWGGEAKGVSTLNLLYPLNKETLLPWQARGISNVALTDEVRVQLTSGDLLAIHTRLNPKMKG